MLVLPVLPLAFVPALSDKVPVTGPGVSSKLRCRDELWLLSSCLLFRPPPEFAVPLVLCEVLTLGFADRVEPRWFMAVLVWPDVGRPAVAE
jgi:hypothetical protein